MDGGAAGGAEQSRRRARLALPGVGTAGCVPGRGPRLGRKAAGRERRRGREVQRVRIGALRCPCPAPSATPPPSRMGTGGEMPQNRLEVSGTPDGRAKPRTQASRTLPISGPAAVSPPILSSLWSLGLAALPAVTSLHSDIQLTSQVRESRALCWSPWEGPHFGNSPSSEGDRCKTALKAG